MIKRHYFFKLECIPHIAETRRTNDPKALTIVTGLFYHTSLMPDPVRVHRDIIEQVCNRDHIFRPDEVYMSVLSRV